MGNLLCPTDDVSHVISVARDICPFPNYTPSPLFYNMLSTNSSVHLRDHYMAVQSSLTPRQLEDFYKSLRSTFGREGKVTLGGMGVVALSLAVLFDTFAKQVRGEWVPNSGPIPDLFVKNPRGYYPPQVHTASELLRLVPHIANNPSRMRKETERYLKRFQFEGQNLISQRQNNTFPNKDASTKVNLNLISLIAAELSKYYRHINGSENIEVPRPEDQLPDSDMIFNLNCDPRTAEEEFLSEMKKFDSETKDIFQKYTKDLGGPLLLQAAMVEYGFGLFKLAFCDRDGDAHPVDFDLDFNSIRKAAGSL